jgi:hypothetical protein
MTAIALEWSSIAVLSLIGTDWIDQRAYPERQNRLALLRRTTWKARILNSVKLAIELDPGSSF